MVRVRTNTQLRTNIRDLASTFVGRAADLAGIDECFAGGARLVTICGPGGMGKTRVALRYAAAKAARFSAHGGGGSWFVDLTDGRSRAEIAGRVAVAIGAELPMQGEDAAIDAIGQALARRGSMLIVLDNFDHLIREAGVVDTWLRSAPRLRLLVTSRVALDVPGETRWPLEALPQQEAVALFLGRARQVRPSLELGTEGQDILRDIVTRLEGIPLALELAAARVAVQSPRELRDRLRNPLAVLVRRNDETRHASMRRAILDSVQLLAPPERAAFAACAVFRGGFTLDAAEAMLGGESALSLIETLSQHSLLRSVSATDPGSELRFSLFETIREVALELHAADPSRAAIKLRHSAYYTGLSRRLAAEAVVRGGAALVRLSHEMENILDAHTCAVERGDAAGALALALGLDPLLSVRGQPRLRRQLIDKALALPSATALDRGVVAQAQLTRGLAARELGDLRAARVVLEAGLALAMAAGLPLLAALAHLRMGEIIEVSGSTVKARERFACALTLLYDPAKAHGEAPDEDDPTRTALAAEAHLRIGHAYRREGALARAEAAVAESTARYRLLGYDEGLAAALYEGAVVAMFQGRAKAAMARYDEGLTIARRVGARTMGAALTTARGCLLQDLGQSAEALAAHAEAARVFHEIGNRHREMSALYYLATAYLDTGVPDEAERILVRAAARGTSVGAPRYAALIAGARAVALSRLGDHAAAADSFRDAERVLEECGSEPALAATLKVHQMTLSPRPAECAAAAQALVAAHPSDDSHFALRMLRATIHPQQSPAPDALVILSGGRGFRLPHTGVLVDVSRRAPLCRILDLLARARRSAPGEPVPVEELIRAGWPGEQILPEAALNRARVGLATLRKLGLSAVLLTAAGGYLLDPAVAISSTVAESGIVPARIGSLLGSRAGSPS